MTIVAICMPERGHVQRLLPMIEGLAARGAVVDVMTDSRFAAEVEAAGGRFVDLFASCPLEAADVTSIPVPSRYVSFAAVYAEEITERVAAHAPALILYDTFAVVAPLVAKRLGAPYVNICAGHAAEPSRTLAALRRDPRVAISAECTAAVRRLREIHGMPDASPFSYVDTMSPFLNVYCEPPQFLDERDRAAFEPVAFFGSLAPTQRERGAASPSFRCSGRRPRIYVSFGTVIWRYFEAAAYAALSVVSEVLADLDVEATLTLGDHALDLPRWARLEQPNVRVERYVDQWAVLKEADVFFTHHGLNSTHEAIFHQVPMVSYPFFGDQPSMATLCRDLGLAVPLAAAPRAPIDRDAVLRALRRLDDERQLFAAKLAQARSWELTTLERRAAVLDRILALA